MFLALIILIFHMLFGFLIENVRNKHLSFTLGIILLIIAMVFTLGINYTADWNMYYWLFISEGDKTDVVFYQLTLLFNSLNLDFKDLVVFHLTCSLLLYFYLIRKFSPNFFYIFLMYILLDYVHFTNQIRYYLGFPILMLGLYYMIEKKKYFLSILLIIISILCHKGLITLLLFIPAYYLIPMRNYLKIIVASSIFIAGVTFLVMQGGLALVIEHYDSYFNKDYNSSLLGGLMNGLPYMVYYTFLLTEYFFSRKREGVVSDSNTLLIKKLTFFPLLFLPGSFFLQILGHRYILPFAIFWGIFYLNLIRNQPKNIRLIKMILFGIVHFVAIYCIYVLPDALDIKNHFLKELELIIQSIPYLDGILN